MGLGEIGLKKKKALERQNLEEENDIRNVNRKMILINTRALIFNFRPLKAPAPKKLRD